jgi:hypothetical protein
MDAISLSVSIKPACVVRSMVLRGVGRCRCSRYRSLAGLFDGVSSTLICAVEAGGVLSAVMWSAAGSGIVVGPSMVLVGARGEMPVVL